MKIGILDLETIGGFSPSKLKIVEIGLVSLDLLTGEKIKLFDEIVHETPLTMDKVQESWIVQNSSLTVEKIRHSPHLDTRREDFQKALDSVPLGVTAFNKRFDFSITDNRGFVIPNKLPCPMKLSRPICKLKDKNGRVGKQPNVEEAWKYFCGDGYKELHRAFDDAYHEADIVKALFDLGVFKID